MDVGKKFPEIPKGVATPRPNRPREEGADPLRLPLPDLLSLAPGGLARPPDYRWGLARHHAAGGDVPLQWVDRWVLLGEELLTTPPGGVRGHPDLEAAATARALFEADWPKVAVETRILAGETFAAIAAKQGLSVAAVEAYAALFYSIADRLGAKSYIAHHAIGLHGPNAHDPRTHIRAYGYAGGPLMADAALAAFTGPPPGPAATPEERRVYRQTRQAIGLRTVPLIPRNFGKLSRLYLLMREHDARMRGRGPTTGATKEV